ncbi:MAG: aspartyl protease family protein [Gammaproteobacteria bacterium]|nr:aspartyl protease family protein [Gammaproteobacteria bacterium]MDH3448203.1 aspartyl protease family protein [Gammaproteobacteria bacterium]
MKALLRFAVLSLALLSTGAASSESGRVALTRLSLGEIGGWLELSIEANAKTGRWLLDTGSSHNLVSAAFAEHHDLPTRSLVSANTAFGKLQGAEVSLPTLRVGSLEQPGQTALVVDLSLVVGAVAEGLDGILGMPFFDGFELELDLRNWDIEIRKGNNGPCPKGMNALVLGQHQGLPVIDVVVNGGQAESLLLDTGNPAGLVRIIANKPPASAPGLVLPGPAHLNLARRVSIGEQIRLNVPVVELYSPSLKRALGKRVGGLAGTALLDGTRLRLDLARRHACVENGQFAVPGGFGLTLELRADGLYVGMVLPGGPAQDAGLQQGDSIQRWVGGPAVGTLQELWSRVQGLDEIELVVGDEAPPVRLRRSYFVPQLP